jgi:hypothetical protein
VSLKFTKLDVQAFDLDHLDLFWEIEDTNESIERWNFYILRSIDGPGGPYESIAGPFRNTNEFRDAEVNQLHNWRTYFYKVKASNKDTSYEEEVGPSYLQAPPDLIAFELRRRFDLLMQEFGGRRVLVYPAITAGFRCRNCFDIGSNDKGRTIGRQKTQNCASCFDSTYVGGFGNPVLAWMQIDPSAIDVQRTDITERAQQDSTCRLSAFPPLKPKDMIVESENVRWQVERVASTQKLRAVVHQEPVLHRIPRNDIRYNVPVDLSVFREAGPVREFTRPMNLESAQSSESVVLTNLLDGMLGEI